MADTSSTINIIFDGTTRGLVAAARIASRAIVGVTKGFAALGAAGGAVGFIGGATAALSQLAGIAPLAVGAIGALVAAKTTFTVATAGFADAVGGDVEAMAKLSPAAREGAKAVQELGKQFDVVRTAVQEEFFRGFSDDVRLLGSTFLPGLKIGMTDVAAAFADVRQASVGALAAPINANSLQVIFQDTATAIRNTGPALGDFAAGLLQVGAIGSDFLPGMTDNLDGVARNFRRFVETNPGRIQEFIASGIQGFKDLGEIIVNISQIIGSIFSGLAGDAASPLASLAALTDQLRIFFDSAAAQGPLQALGEVLRTVSAIMGQLLLTTLRELGPVIQAVAPLVSALASAFGLIATSAITTLGPLLTDLANLLSGALAPVLPVLTAALTNLIEQGLGPFISAISGPFASILAVAVDLLATLASAVAPVLGALAPLVSLLGTTLANVLTTLAPIITQVAGIISDLLVGALEALQPLFVALRPVIEQLAVLIAEQLTRALDAITPLVPVIVDGFTQLVTALIPLLPIITNLATAVIPPLIDAFIAVVPAITPMVEAIVSIATALIAILIPIIDFAAQIIAIFVQMAAAVIETVVNFVTSVIQFFLDLINAVVTGLAGWVPQVIQFFADLVTGALAWVTTLVTDVATGFVDMVTNAIAKAGELVAGVVGFFAGLPGQVMQWVLDTGAQLVAEFIRMKDEAIAKVRELVDGAVKFLQELPAKALQAAKDMVNGMVQGIKDGIGAVGQAAQDLANSAWENITGFFGINSPSTLMRWGGQQATEGFALGWTDGMGDVVASARAVGEAAREAALAPVDGLALDLTAANTALSAQAAAAAGSGTAALLDLLGRPVDTPQANVRVFIGDQELRGLVRVEVDDSERETIQRAGAGPGASY